MTATSTLQAGNFTNGNSKASQSESSLVHETSKQGQVVMVRRDTGQKTPVKEADIPATLEKLLVEIQDNLFAKAKAILQEKTTTVQNYEEFKSVLCEKGGFIKAAWCGSADDEAKIKDETGATIQSSTFPERRANHQLRLSVDRKLKK